jgi:hypothetical protein
LPAVECARILIARDSTKAAAIGRAIVDAFATMGARPTWKKPVEKTFGDLAREAERAGALR